MSSYLVPQKFVVAGVGGDFMHDGINDWSEDIIPLTGRAVVNYITLPNQVLYDADGDDPSPIVPVPVTASTIYEGTSQVDVMAKVENWMSLVGYKGVLTATRVSDVGTTYSCTARLESVEVTNPFKFIEADDSAKSRLKVTFRPSTNWVLDP